jgi:hypothetical protein
VGFPANGKVTFAYEYSDELNGQPRATTEKLEYTISETPAGD